MLRRFYQRHKTLSHFSVSSLALNLAGLVTSLLVYRYIEPQYMGIWQTLILIETYSVLLRIGILNGMNRELSFLIGRGDQEDAMKCVETTLHFTLVNMAVFTALFVLALVFIRIPPGQYLPLACVYIITVLNFYYSFVLGTFRVKKDFGTLSRIQFFQTALKVASLIMVVGWGSTGFFLREVLMVAAVTLVVHAYRPIRVKARFSGVHFRQLLAIGFPIFAGSYLTAFFTTLPRLFIIDRGTATMLGLYAPLMTVLALFSAIPDSFTTYFYPKLTTSLGEGAGHAEIWRQSQRIQLFLLLLFIPVVAAGYFIIPPAVEQWLPKYSGSVPVIQTGIFIALFSGYRFGYTTLISLKAWRAIIAYIAIMGITFFMGPWILLHYYDTLTAVVGGQVISTGIMFIASLIITYYATHHVKAQNLAVADSR